MIMAEIGLDAKTHKIDTIVPCSTGFGLFQIEVEVSETGLNMSETIKYHT